MIFKAGLGLKAARASARTEFEVGLVLKRGAPRRHSFQARWYIKLCVCEPASPSISPKGCREKMPSQKKCPHFGEGREGDLEMLRTHKRRPCARAEAMQTCSENSYAPRRHSFQARWYIKLCVCEPASPSISPKGCREKMPSQKKCPYLQAPLTTMLFQLKKHPQTCMHRAPIFACHLVTTEHSIAQTSALGLPLQHCKMLWQSQHICGWDRAQPTWCAIVLLLCAPAAAHAVAK